MSEINVRSDAVDVEQIMRQIRARIREKRGADYTEAELQQLATVKLEKFLDPRGVRSDLVQQFRKQRTVAPAPPNFEFGETDVYETHRGLLATLRRLLHPLLKPLFNPDKITSALHVQAQVNAQAEQRLRRLEEREPLSYELLHNLTLEVTRLGIEVHNLKMRVESLSSRMDFDERRGRSLENVVEYRQKPQAPPRSGRHVTARRPAAAGARSPCRRPRQWRAAGLRGRAGRSRRQRRRPARRTVRPATANGAGDGADAGAAPARPWPARRGAAWSSDSRRWWRQAGVGSPAGGREARAMMTATTRRIGGRRDGAVKLGVVVQRYGADINGGAELHARYIAERLSRHAEVEVLTTCARDYVTWENELPAGEETVNGVTVRRFPVSHPRHPGRFGRLSAQVFDARTRWPTNCAGSTAKGPASPALIRAHQGVGRRRSISSCSSARGTTTRGTAYARCRPRRCSCRPPSAIRRSASASFGPVLPRRARHHVQLARGARPASRP